jgi:hypothetical protein
MIGTLDMGPNEPEFDVYGSRPECFDEDLPADFGRKAKECTGELVVFQFGEILLGRGRSEGVPFKSEVAGWCGRLAARFVAELLEQSLQEIERHP